MVAYRSVQLWNVNLTAAFPACKVLFPPDLPARKTIDRSGSGSKKMLATQWVAWKMAYDEEAGCSEPSAAISTDRRAGDHAGGLASRLEGAGDASGIGR